MTAADITAIADTIDRAFAGRQPIAPFEGLDLDAAYAVAQAIDRRRQAAGERVVGMKIGFTNRTIWDEYGVHAPMWGYMYDTTVSALSGPVSLEPFMEPRIEPEICFGFSRAPSPEMSDADLLECIAWISHGFEIVQSPFRNWKFAAPDTVAARGLHGAMLLGPKYSPDAHGAFEITLAGSNAVVEHGNTALVLGGPLAALRHALEIGCPVQAGHMVTTGTLTRAMPVAAGQTWRTELAGTAIKGIQVTFA